MKAEAQKLELSFTFQNVKISNVRNNLFENEFEEELTLSPLTIYTFIKC